MSSIVNYLWGVRISAPSSVISIMCSNCADLLSSCDTAVQPSDRMAIASLPSIIIGSERGVVNSKARLFHVMRNPMVHGTDLACLKCVQHARANISSLNANYE